MNPDPCFRPNTSYGLCKTRTSRMKFCGINNQNVDHFTWPSGQVGRITKKSSLGLSCEIRREKGGQEREQLLSVLMWHEPKRRSDQTTDDMHAFYSSLRQFQSHPWGWFVPAVCYQTFTCLVYLQTQVFCLRGCRAVFWFLCGRCTCRGIHTWIEIH